MEIPKKICRKCGIEKMFPEFQRCNWNRTGLDGTCKECRKAAKNLTEIERLRKTHPDDGCETWWRRR